MAPFSARLNEPVMSHSPVSHISTAESAMLVNVLHLSLYTHRKYTHRASSVDLSLSLTGGVCCGSNTPNFVSCMFFFALALMRRRRGRVLPDSLMLGIHERIYDIEPVLQELLNAHG